MHGPEARLLEAEGLLVPRRFATAQAFLPQSYEVILAKSRCCFLFRLILDSGFSDRRRFVAYITEYIVDSCGEETGE